MSQPKTLWHDVYFHREGVGYAQTTSPAPTLSGTAANYLGTCIGISIATEAEEAIFEKPVGGKWVDFKALNQRDRQVWTFNMNELSPHFWELAMSHSTALSGGGATVTPGGTITHLGWLEVVTKDDANAAIATTKLWVKLDLPSVDFPQTGYVNPTFTARKLYSASNTSTLANIS